MHAFFRDEQQQLLRRLKGYLNKLTLEKFDKLYTQILGAGIKEKEEVNALMKMVFEKAVSQHHFIQVCRLFSCSTTLRRVLQSGKQRVVAPGFGFRIFRVPDFSLRMERMASV